MKKETGKIWGQIWTDINYKFLFILESKANKYRRYKSGFLFYLNFLHASSSYNFLYLRYAN